MAAIPLEIVDPRRSMSALPHHSPLPPLPFPIADILTPAESICIVINPRDYYSIELLPLDVIGCNMVHSGDVGVGENLFWASAWSNGPAQTITNTQVDQP